MRNVRFSFNAIKIFTKNQMQTKSYLILDIINMIARCLVVFILYAYVFKVSGGDINGVDYKSTIWSMFIYFCLMTFKIRHVYKFVMDDVKSGNVEMFLNKPISYLLITFCKAIGKGLYSFIFVTVVGTICMILFVGIPSLNLSIFIPTLIITIFLGQLLGLFMYSIIGLLSFFMQDVRPIFWISDKLVMLLGGSYLPIALFPKFMKDFAYISPFGAINFATSTVLSSWNNEYMIRILIQIVWIVVFGILLKFVYKKAREKAMINGG